MPPSPARQLRGLLLVLAIAATACTGPKMPVGPGVTAEACPQAVDQDHGCIYLGVISDLTEGPFAQLGVPITDAQRAFWRRVNEQGGIGGYDIDVTTYVRDNHYDVQAHTRAYREIKDEVLSLAQTLGAPTTAAIVEDLAASDLVAVPDSWTSGWLYEPTVLESGASYCIEAMNAVDYAAAERQVSQVMAVHYDGDYGDDAAVGARIAAQGNDADFTSVEQIPKAAGGTTRGAVDAIVAQSPDVVILATGPTEVGEIVAQAAARGYKGQFIGTNRSWTPALLKTSAAGALKRQFLQTAPWSTFTADTPGHQAMREALGPAVIPSDAYTAGWVESYPLKAALKRAVASRDLTRRGLLDAVGALAAVDYEGMLPAAAGDHSGDPDAQAFRQNVVNRPDDASPTGLTEVKGFFTGPTAARYVFGDQPCFRQ